MATTSPVAKYHLIEITLAARIRDGAYDADGLPGERELAAEFAVARVTIRNALQRLEDQGLVMRRERSGTTAISGRGNAQARRLLRDHVDKFLDRGRKDTRKVLRLETVGATPAVADALRVPHGTRVLRIVRLRSNSGAPLTYTEAFVPQRLASSITRVALTRKAFMQVLEESGIRVGAAEQSFRAEGAPPVVADALAIPLNAPILKITRIVHDEDGAPIQLLLGWYRGDRFEVRMQMSRKEDVTKVWVEHH